jgi:OOP family OmpA-OmpF porin
MRVRTWLLVFALCLVMPAGLFAQEDSEGCKDSPLLTRLTGCYISDCSKSEFDAAELNVSISDTKHVEGKIEKIHYECSGKSALQVRRNAEQALRSAGYTLDFTGYDVPNHYVTAHKGAQWIGVTAHEMTGECSYDVVTVLTQEMTQEMTANADAWAAEIDKTGHVAVYGIEFDTGKATLKPDSEKTLAEVLKLLNNRPDWKMKIEGHTDSTGTKAGNQTLSQRRADAVVAWLVKNGIVPTRLTAVGLGDTRPIADNSTDEGRARNRRVELVKE